MFHEFINIVKNKYGYLNESEIEFLKNKTNIKFYKKREVFFSAGNIQKYAYFVLEGHVRLFYNNNGDHKTGFFYKKGCFIWPEAGDKVTQRNYSCIEDSVLVLISKRAIIELIENSINFSSIYGVSKEQELKMYQQLIAFFITLSPEERYRYLISEKGSIFNKVPQSYIASFIGISAESLSRIKRRIYKEQLCAK